MSRKKDAVEKTFCELHPFEQHVATLLGRTGLDAVRTGVYAIAQWLWALADCKTRHPLESDRKQRERICFQDCSTELEALLLEAARKQDGTKLRWLADAIELVGPRKPHDPLRSILLNLKDGSLKPMTAREVKERIRRICPAKTPTEKTIHRVAKQMTAPLATGKRGPAKGTRQKSVHRVK